MVTNPATPSTIPRPSITTSMSSFFISSYTHPHFIPSLFFNTQYPLQSPPFSFSQNHHLHHHPIHQPLPSPPPTHLPLSSHLKLLRLQLQCTKCVFMDNRDDEKDPSPEFPARLPLFGTSPERVAAYFADVLRECNQLMP